MSNFRFYLKQSLAVILLIFAGCQKQATPDIHPPVYGVMGKQAMVSTAHPAATQVGVDILKSGGNAFDAAIAVQLALAVVYPRAGNIGGGGFLVYRQHDGNIGSLDFREMAPLQAHKDMYLDENQEVIENLSTLGHLAAGVPGTVDGMIKIHQKLGSMPFASLVQPAIDLALGGVVLTEKEASKFNEHQENFALVNEHRTHLQNEQPWQPGDTVFYRDLGQTLTLIRDQGRAGFYHGTTAQLIVEEMQRGGGLISREDLQNYQAVWRQPLVGHYRSHKIITMGPPSSGGIAILQLLAGVEPHDIESWGFNQPKTIHLMTELERRVYADRATYLGDPDFYDVPIDMLLDHNYLAENYSSISYDHKTSSQDIKSGHVEIIESMETTHFSIVDARGNAASVTTTLNGSFGSKVVVKGAGFLLNNEMDDFSVKPGVPNMFGLVGAEANSIAPEKRMLSSMTPTIVEKNDSLYMVVGTPGGSTIITSVFQTILNVIDHGMTMQEAVNAKKFHHQWLPDEVYYEVNALDSTTLSELSTMGHVMKPRSEIGRMDCILVTDQGLEGAADSRGDNTAIGY